MAASFGAAMPAIGAEDGVGVDDAVELAGTDKEVALSIMEGMALGLDAGVAGDTFGAAAAILGAAAADSAGAGGVDIAGAAVDAWIWPSSIWATSCALLTARKAEMRSESTIRVEVNILECEMENLGAIRKILGADWG